jgi:predicted O-methyltransferase YrrM
MTKLKKLLDNPIKTLKILNRKYLQLGLVSKDPDLFSMKSWVYGKLPRENLTNIFPNIEEMSYQLVKAFRRTADMSITIVELNALIAIQKFVKAKNVLEIGTYDGGITLNIAANLPENGKVYTIDLPEGFTRFSYKIDEVCNNSVDPKIVGTQYKGSQYENKIVQILQDSARVDYKSLDVKFDLVFIDGCHDYQYAKNDYLNTVNCVKKGGVIIWHDYGMIEDVSKFVDELSEKKEIHVIKGCRMALTIV